ncbi:MAG: C13 family peptidase [Planctomycetota bacterium]
MKSGLTIIACIMLAVLITPIAAAQIVNPEQAQNHVLHNLLNGDTAGKRVMVHPERLQAGASVETWHKTAIVTPSEGYVVFIDDMAYANFEHPCRYVFVDGKNGEMVMAEATTPPREMLKWREMETEASKVLSKARNVRPERAAKRAPSRKTPKGGEYYAVLMSGGASSGNNHVRYWNDLSNIYVTLVDSYGYKDENIIVLCSDGLDPAPDQSNSLNSDPDLDGDGDDDIMYSCIVSNVQLVFNQLATTLTENDQLFIFTTDHGGSNSGWSVYENMWNFETLADSALAAMVDALPDCTIITTMEQCYSGGFEDDLTATDRVFSSAAAYNEVSWAMPPDYVYDTYVFFWTAAVKGEDAYGVPCNADLNGDNLVSIHEAFVYAEANDISDETPQYDSVPAGLGDILFLGQGPALIFAFPEELPEGLQLPGPAEKLRVAIKSGLEVYVPGTAELHYRMEAGSAFTTVPLTPVSGDLFEAVLPNTKPGDAPEFYFSAQGDGGTQIHSPFNAPDELYSFEVCFIETVMKDDFEAPSGWTVQNQNIQTGAWEWADPAGTTAQPEEDHSPDGTQCYVTGRLGGSIGDDDVDGGPTQLTSPLIDLSMGDANINFYLYFYHTDYGTQQPLELHITNDRRTWVKVKDVTHSATWVLHSIKVSDFVTPNEKVQIRLTVSDNPNDDVVEALLDDLSVDRLNYDPALWADAYAFSAASRAVIHLSLDAGSSKAGRPYLVLGSMSGTSPGFALPGGEMLPLNWDLFTDFILLCLNSQICQQFYSVLDASGTSAATLDTQGPLDPSLAGVTVHLAYLLGYPFEFTSNPIQIDIDP